MELERSLGRDRGAAGEKDGQVGTYLKLRDGDRQAKRQKLSSEQRCMETEPEVHQRHRETRQRRPGDGGAVQSQVSFYEDHVRSLTIRRKQKLRTRPRDGCLGTKGGACFADTSSWSSTDVTQHFSG